MKMEMELTPPESSQEIKGEKEQNSAIPSTNEARKPSPTLDAAPSRLSAAIAKARGAASPDNVEAGIQFLNEASAGIIDPELDALSWSPTAEEADAYLRGKGIIKKCEACGQDATLTNNFVTHLVDRHAEVARQRNALVDALKRIETTGDKTLLHPEPFTDSEDRAYQRGANAAFAQVAWDARAGLAAVENNSTRIDGASPRPLVDGKQ